MPDPPPPPLPPLLHRLLLPLLISSLLAISFGQQHIQGPTNGCGPGQVPAQVQVHADGRPELFCHRPPCSLFPDGPRRTVPTTTRTTTQRIPDGREIEEEEEGEEKERDREEMEENTGEEERRRSRRTTRKRRKRRNAEGQIVNCADTLSDIVCDLPDEWTGAVTEVNNGTHISLFMQCCAVEHLSEWAAPLKQVVLMPGEQFGGGPVLHNGQVVAFDLVKEVRKNVTEQNEVRYVLSVHRALCAVPVSALNTPVPSASPSTFARLYGTRRFTTGDDSTSGPNSVEIDTNTARKTQNEHPERRRHPELPPAPADQQQSTAAASLDDHPSSVSAAPSTAAVSAWSATDFGTSDTVPPPLTQQMPSISSLPASSPFTPSPPPMTTVASQRLRALMLPQRGQHRHQEHFRQLHRRPIYARRHYRPVGLEESGGGDSEEQSPSDYEDSPEVRGWQGGGRGGGSGRPPWTHLRRVGPVTAEGRRTIGGGRRHKYTGLTTIRHQTGSRNRNAMVGNQPTDEAQGRLGRYGRKEEAAVVRARTYASQGTYAPPDRQLDLKGAPESDYEGPDLQSVVEQQVLDEISDAALARELADAVSAATAPPLPSPSATTTTTTTAQPRAAQLQLSRPTQQQTVHPQKNGAKQQKMASAPFPTLINHLDQQSPSGTSATGGGCSTNSLLARTSRSDGGGGCGGEGTGPAPLEITLSCGSCSCSQCQCSSLPEPCNGPSCPACPSVCDCPSECGCGAGGGPSGSEYYESSNAIDPNQAYQQQYNQWYQQYGQQYYQGQGYQGQAYTGGAGMNAAFASLQCFSGDQRVRTPRGIVRMDRLRVGDLVLTMDQSLLSFSPVVMFLHRKPPEMATYIQIHTDGGHTLKLTRLHLIWAGCVGRLRLIRAEELRPGECVYALGGGERMWDREADKENGTDERMDRVRRAAEKQTQLRMVPNRIISIQQLRQRGIFAPLTANGNILVNDILASCHANMAAQTLQQTFFAWWRTLRTFAEGPRRWWRGRGEEEEEMEQWQHGVGDEHGGGGGELPLGLHFLISVLDSLVPVH